MMFLKRNKSDLVLKLRNILFYTLIVLSFVSCAVKQPAYLIDNKERVLAEIHKNNPQKCDYKGSVFVIYKDGEEDVRFRAMLDKRCSEEFDMKILGAFAQVIYDISYRHGDVTAYEKGVESSEKIRLFMKNRGLDSLILGLRYPYTLPDESYFMSLGTESYFFRKPFTEIVVGSDTKIKRIRLDQVTYEYDYANGEISIIRLKQGRKILEIGLKN